MAASMLCGMIPEIIQLRMVVVDDLVPSGHQVIFNHHDDIVKSVYIVSASLNKIGCETTHHTDQILLSLTTRKSVPAFHY